MRAREGSVEGKVQGTRKGVSVSRRELKGNGRA